MRAGLIAAAGLYLAAGVSAQDYREPRLKSKDREHWAFRPLVRPEPPGVKHETAVRNPIDRFILARVEAAGVEPQAGADRTTLIRRVTFDLTGLPPAPGDVEAFLKDTSLDAYGNVVDRLLNSRAYGERWAQIWLDQARFAETDGFEHDKVRPQAWRYRDWVIDALNRDVPYDRFVKLQLAGDEIDPGNKESALATGFLLSGPDMVDINLQSERKHEFLNDMTGTVGQVFMGLTVGCAQCHDHFFDPISQADFYRMRAVFSNTIWPKRNKQLGSVAREPGPKAAQDHLIIRGDFRRVGMELKPGFPRILNPEEHPFKAAPTEKSSGRRRAFAEWLTRPDHLLTGRLVMNWLWVHHFGRGIVATPSDFGAQGEKPTHPKLLDWLATELPRRGWSLKAMHKLIVTSATYRQASRPIGAPDEDWIAAKKADPLNILLWRMNRRRIEGEALRDAMLTVCGRMSERRGGPGVRPPLPKEVTVTLLRNQWKVSPDEEDHRRGSVYIFARRNLKFPMFDMFDRPSANACCAQRDESTTAVQSLLLINSVFSIDSASALAGRLVREAGAEPSDRVDLAYRLALGRVPGPRELERSVRFLVSQAERLRAENRPRKTLSLPRDLAEGQDPYAAAALTDLCLALFNVNEFVYID